MHLKFLLLLKTLTFAGRVPKMKIKKLLGAIRNRDASLPVQVELDSSEIWKQGGFTSIANFQANDIFLVGFPKSGNTWMQNLVAGVLFGMDTNFLTDKLAQLLVPNVHGFGYYKRVSDFTCFKSHFLPRPEYRRVVYIVRDGRDAMASYYHMNNAVSESPVSLADMVISGTGVFPCKWYEHVKQWLANPYNAELIVIRYEDLHEQPLLELKKFCEFAGIERSDDVLQRSIQGNRFERMQAKELEFGWDNANWNKDEKFIRKGKVGSFREELPVELINSFEEESEDQLLAFGYQMSS